MCVMISNSLLLAAWRTSGLDWWAVGQRLAITWAGHSISALTAWAPETSWSAFYFQGTSTGHNQKKTLHLQIFQFVEDSGKWTIVDCTPESPGACGGSHIVISSASTDLTSCPYDAPGPFQWVVLNFPLRRDRILSSHQLLQILHWWLSAWRRLHGVCYRWNSRFHLRRQWQPHLAGLHVTERKAVCGYYWHKEKKTFYFVKLKFDKTKNIKHCLGQEWGW